MSFLAALLYSGKHANSVKRKHEFYSEILQQMNAEEQARATRVEQEAIHEAKIRQQANLEEKLAVNLK